MPGAPGASKDDQWKLNGAIELSVGDDSDRGTSSESLLRRKSVVGESSQSVTVEDEGKGEGGPGDAVVPAIVPGSVSWSEPGVERKEAFELKVCWCS